MMSDTETKYKNTSIGIIPIDWEVKSLSKVGEIHSGGTPRTHNLKYWNGEIHWCTPTDITKNNNKYIFNTEKTISHLGLNSSSAKLLPINSIIVSTRASIGKVVINKIEMCTNQGFKNIVPFKEIDFEYLYYNILFLEHVFLRKASGSTFQELSKNDFSKIQIPVPKLPEQQKIAKILSTWDKAIQETTDIVKALEKRNKVLGNNLLNNKTWEKKKLKALFTRIIDKNSEGNQNVTTISARHGFIKQNQFFNKTVASENLSGYYLIMKDDFCYNKSYSNGYDWGVVKRLNDFEKAVVTTLYICFRLHATDQNIDFWELYFANNILDKGLSKIAHEGGRAHGLLNVTANDFFSLKIGVPTIEEQNEIAKILSIANEELQQYKQKLENLKQQKKGLMQQLLTGKTRTI